MSSQHPAPADLAPRPSVPSDGVPVTTAPRPAAPAPTRLPEVPDLGALLAALTLEDKVRLLTGATAWRLHALEHVGLRSVVVSDGPAGVRGTSEKPGETSASFPAPSALSATWDTDLAARLGHLFAFEARRHGVDVVLAPQVNLQRTPVAGRHFECYSEDPHLTSQVAGALVGAMQDGGVGACVKHFVANDAETARTEAISRVDERTLREVYLAPFDHLVRDVGAWSVMAGYNSVDDGVRSATATEHHHLLTELLKEEWGFDGVVVSDWLATRSTTASANAGLDLVMPGPGGPWEQHLLAAVRAGEVAESVVDDKVLRLLLLAHRVGALGGEIPAPPAEEGLLRELAARATVVLRDEGHRLPLDPRTVRTVALVGPNAVDAFVQGGGSAHVTPDDVVTPEQGLRTALPDATVTVLRGGNARRHAPDLDIPGRVSDPVTGAPGLRVELLDADGAVVAARAEPGWEGWLRDLPADVAAVRLTASVHLAEPGEHVLGVGTVGRYDVVVDGVTAGTQAAAAGAEVVLDSTVNSPDAVSRSVEVTEPRDVLLVATLQNIVTQGYGSFVRAALRHRVPGPSVGDEMAEAVAAARDADLTVVVVGTNNEVESEGFDRDTLALPGRQDELVERVLDVAPDAVVVVNAGAPVLLPWLERARTVLWTWFPGQECGDALADVLLGVTEPSGRLPWTLPARESDVPVPHAVPDADGVVTYTEGIHVGYRSWERLGRTPALPFGHGLGWTDWSYDDVRPAGTGPDGALLLDVDVTDVGPRAGREVVQVYLEAPDGGPERPVRWLGGFAVVDAPAGGSATARVRVPRRAFEVWDPATAGWVTPPGTYRARIGRSVRDLRLTLDVSPPAHP